MTLRSSLTGLLALIVAVLLTAGAVSAQASILISQYVETNSGTTPKGLELYNASGQSIDLSATPIDVLQGTNGGALSSRVTINTGTFAPGEVIVVGTSDIGHTSQPRTVRRALSRKGFSSTETMRSGLNSMASIRTRLATQGMTQGPLGLETT